MKLEDIVLKRFVLSDFEENAYVVSLKGRDDCVVIDPGMGAERIVEFLQQNRLTPRAILVTHGHWDHIGGIAAIRGIWKDASIYIGAKERSKLTDPNGNLSSAFGFPLTTCDADKLLQDDENFEVAGLTFQALEVPGHSAGHVVYLLELEEVPFVFCGDVVFAGSIGRTDFADGNYSLLVKKIKEKIFPLSDETFLYPGHGPNTTLKKEKRTNPFLI